MMRIAVWILIIFGAATLIAVGAYYNSGYVLFIAPPYRVDMSMNLLVVIVLALIFGSYGIVKLLVKTMTLPATLRKMSQRRKERESYKALAKAVIAHFEGRYTTAEKSARETLQNEECKTAGALIGASSAYFLNKPEVQLEYAQNIDKNHELAKASTDVLSFLQKQQPEEAFKTLQLIESKLGKSVATVELELRIYKQQNDWANILKLIDTLTSRHVLTKTEAEDLRFKCHSELLKLNAQNPSALVQYFNHVEDELKNNNVFITLTLDLLASNENSTKITADFIEQQLKNTWNEAYLSAYVTLAEQADNHFVSHQVKVVEKLLSQHADNEELLLALGQLYCKLSQFDKALDFANKALAIQELNAETQSLLGLIAESTGNQDLALQHYKLSAQLINHCR